jgi:putative endonuclease
MFTVYVIRSARGIRYTGYTENLTKRLEQHNAGISKFTSRDFNWQLLYQETYETRAEAMRREKWLKSGEGRRFIDAIGGRKTSGS